MPLTISEGALLLQKSKSEGFLVHRRGTTTSIKKIEKHKEVSAFHTSQPSINLLI
jgi:hypothetical protein